MKFLRSLEIPDAKAEIQKQFLRTRLDEEKQYYQA